MWRRVFVHPLVLFLTAGAVLAALSSTTGTAPSPGPVSLSSEDLAGLQREWQALHGGIPDDEAWRALVREAVDDELLVREARALGFVRSDPVVRQRLLRDLDFLEEPGSGPERSEDERVARALALELDRGDLVVQRRLAQRMRALLSAAGRDAPVDPEVIAERFARRRADGLETLPARWRLTQIYLGPRPVDPTEVAAIRERARRLGPQRAAELARPFLVGSDLGPATARELSLRLGEPFAAALGALPEREWSGPVPSSYGLHLVFVHEHIAERERTLEEAAPAIEREIRDERGASALRAALARLRAGVEIRVAPIPGRS